jgi:phosphatidate cytidylyltransferase
MLRGLGLRVASGVVLLGLVLAAIWVRGPLLVGLVGLAAVLGAHEFYTMARRAGYLPWYPAGVALALLLALRGYVGAEQAGPSAGPDPGLAAELMGLSLVLLLALARQALAWWRAPAPAPGVEGGPGTSRGPYLAWGDLGITLGGAVYTGGLLGYALLLAALPDRPVSAGGGGSAWLLLVLLGTAACDTGAYFVGSAVGRHKLIPHISPGKTWEGLAGGALGAVLAAVALAGVLGIDGPEAVVLGLVVCAAAVLGDLGESLVKRAAGVKDSGNIVPGHGGMLDRMDSILFVLPAVYWFVRVATGV